jgi:hypothetical protein
VEDLGPLGQAIEDGVGHGVSVIMHGATKHEQGIPLDPPFRRWYRPAP